MRLPRTVARSGSDSRRNRHKCSCVGNDFFFWQRGSTEILCEYEEVLRRRKFAFDADEIESFLGWIRSHGELVRSVPIKPTSPDPDDDKFIACALASEAEFLVTGNKRHFRESWLRGTKLVNARELIQEIVPML